LKNLLGAKARIFTNENCFFIPYKQLELNKSFSVKSLSELWKIFTVGIVFHFMPNVLFRHLLICTITVVFKSRNQNCCFSLSRVLRRCWRSTADDAVGFNSRCLKVGCVVSTLFHSVERTKRFQKKDFSNKPVLNLSERF